MMAMTMMKITLVNGGDENIKNNEYYNNKNGNGRNNIIMKRKIIW